MNPRFKQHRRVLW